MDSSKAPVVVIVAIILMGAIIWGVWAVRMAGGVDPERAKTLAQEAERECVLRGFEPERCRKLVGENQRDCIQETKRKTEKALLDESIYLECMTEAFGTPEGESDEGETDDAGPSPDGGESGDAGATPDGGVSPGAPTAPDTEETDG